MLCSKCFEEIPQRREVQLNCSIICKECAVIEIKTKEVIGWCHNCHEPIHKDEFSWKKSSNWGFTVYFLNRNWSKDEIQCLQCYKKGWPF